MRQNTRAVALQLLRATTYPLSTRQSSMFRLTIRDVLWLTVVVAMGVAWWMDRRKAFEERAHISRNAKELADELEHGRYGMRPLPEWINERRSSD